MAGRNKRILVVGANGYVGRSVVRMLCDAGHEVTALARSDETAAALQRRNIRALRADPGLIAERSDGLRDYDACIWHAFIPLRQEQALVAPVLAALEDTDKSFIFTSGTAVLGIPSPWGEWNEESFAEDEPFVPPPGQTIRRDTENLVRSFGERGVRAMVVRPPLIWGHGGSRQIPWIFETAARTGRACYVGQGLNVYSHVHVDDLAHVYLLALERGTAGALYHAVAGEENFRTLAEAVATVAGCDTQSVGLAEMSRMIGRTAAQVAFAMNSRSRCPRTRRELGWVPEHRDIVQDIRAGSYLARFGRSRANDAPIFQESLGER